MRREHHLRSGGLAGTDQRVGSDVDAQIQRWGALSVSLREMQGELAHSYMGVLDQRTLLQRLHQLQTLTPGSDERPTPPILQLGAIWFTQLYSPRGQIAFLIAGSGVQCLV